MQRIIIGLMISLSVMSFKGQIPGTIISLNGVWDFEQTSTAFPPVNYTGRCPVPGLIHLAEPKINAYDKLFQTPEKSFYEETSDYRVIKYEPKYSWYRRIVDIPDLKDGIEVMLTILKSQFVTQVYINGHDAGQSVACYTPIRLRITGWLKPGQPNEILIRVGERIWLPPWAAGSTDKEKANYIPGIWDDVFLSFSGKQKILKSLFLPSVKENTVTSKFILRSFYPQQVMYGDPMSDSVKISVVIKEKISGSVLSEASLTGLTVRDNESQLELKIPVRDYSLWSPETPFLYEAEIKLYDGRVLSDTKSEVFGMRDFERKGKYFFLNGEKYILRGTNITMHRFLEDPDCRALPWDREWVKKMLIDDPKKIGWNAMRICVGLVPDFWYDLADEYGIMFQNEWMYWQNHGWDQQIREEYTDWVWSDGNHPAIVIWDAINENWNSFIGNVLIPELQQLDPTRIWDAGYMTASEMKTEDPVDEPHPYRAGWGFNNSDDPAEYIRKNPYLLGKMDDWEEGHKRYLTASAAQIVNEYGWNWLWRDGQPAKLTKKAYDFLIGENATPAQRREFQAYWLQCETEWLRAERSFAGVLAFTHLTNNYGFTGDWYINNIKDLETGPSFAWFRHAFAKTNVFIDLADQRYFPNGNYEPKQKIEFKLVGVNDNKETVSGRIELSLIGQGNKILKTIRTEITIPPFGRTDQPVSLQLPSKSGGYLVETKFRSSGSSQIYKSRRYIKIGGSGKMIFPETEP